MDNNLVNSFLNSINALTWIKNKQGVYVHMSASYEEKLGIPKDSWVGKTDEDLFDTVTAAKFKQTDLTAINKKEFVQTFEYAKNKNTDKEARYWFITKSYFEKNGEGFIGGIMNDCTDKCLEIMSSLKSTVDEEFGSNSNSSEKNYDLDKVPSYYKDDLTGLLNRKGFALEFEKTILNNDLKPTSIFLSIDLNGLKQVNDTKGHLEGDLFITEFGSVLKKFFRKNDLISRNGGDEFCILCKNPLDVEKRIHRIRKYLSKLPSNITFACGWVVVDKEKTLTTINHEADMMMYDNKKKMKLSASSSIKI